MKNDNNIIVNDILEMAMSQGTQEMTEPFSLFFNHEIGEEREHCLGAKSYDGISSRQEYAYGYNSRRPSPQVGAINVNIPKTREGDAHFYPQCLGLVSRSSMAVLSNICKMYIKWGATSEVEMIFQQFSSKNISSAQILHMIKALDAEIKARCNRQPNIYLYVILDACCEKIRVGGGDQVLSEHVAIEINQDGKKAGHGNLPSVFVAKIHWHKILDSFASRGLSDVKFIVPDVYAGLFKAKRGVIGAVLWPKCQFYFAKNAIYHAHNQQIREIKGAQLWIQMSTDTDADAIEEPHQKHNQLYGYYHNKQPMPVKWMGHNIIEGLTAFKLLKSHQKRMWTSSFIKKAFMQESKRRGTRKIWLLPNTEEALRSIATVLMEMDKKWEFFLKKSINWKIEDCIFHKVSLIYRQNIA